MPISATENKIEEQVSTVSNIDKNTYGNRTMAVNPNEDFSIHDTIKFYMNDKKTNFEGIDYQTNSLKYNFLCYMDAWGYAGEDHIPTRFLLDILYHIINNIYPESGIWFLLWMLRMRPKVLIPLGVITATGGIETNGIMGEWSILYGEETHNYAALVIGFMGSWINFGTYLRMEGFAICVVAIPT